MKNKKGFTLIELLIVIAIIALLATLAIISLTTAQRKARDTKRLADVKSIQSSVELYYSDNSSYPTPNTSFATTMADYMQVPNPPDNNSNYKYGMSGTSYVVSCDLEETAHDAMANSGQTAFACPAATCVEWDEDGAYAATTATIDCGDALPAADNGIYCAEG